MNILERYRRWAKRRNDSIYFRRKTGFWGWPDALRIHGSCLPSIIGQLSVILAFSVVVTYVHLNTDIKLALPQSAVPSITIVLGLLLVFRTNTAYDRYWEGRKVWSSLQTHVAVLTRIVWLQIPETKMPNMSGDPVPREEKKTVLNYLIGCIIGIKHRARDERGLGYVDYDGMIPPSLEHIADAKPDLPPTRVPLEIVYRLSRYFEHLLNRSSIPYSTYSSLMSGINGIQDAISSIDRIRNTPMPLAYLIHMKQSVFLYCCILPFAMVDVIGYLTPFIVFVSSFTLLGLDGIGCEIEMPFGSDWNDLRLDYFIYSMRREMLYVMEREGGLSMSTASASEILE